jgi:hypothetical protein
MKFLNRRHSAVHVTAVTVRTVINTKNWSDAWCLLAVTTEAQPHPCATLDRCLDPCSLPPPPPPPAAPPVAPTASFPRAARAAQVASGSIAASSLRSLAMRAELTTRASERNTRCRSQQQAHSDGHKLTCSETRHVSSHCIYCEAAVGARPRVCRT